MTDAEWIFVAKFLITVNAANFLLDAYKQWLDWRVKTLTAKKSALLAKLGEKAQAKKPDPIVVEITADNSDAMTKIRETTEAGQKLADVMELVIVRVTQARDLQEKFRKGMN